MKLKELGSILYLCEGSKPRKEPKGRDGLRKAVEFVNSDPHLLRIFIIYLRTFGIDESRLRCKLFIHDGDDERRCRIFWSQWLGIPLSQFYQTIIKKSSGYRHNRHPNGCVAIRYHDRRIYELIERNIAETMASILVVTKVASRPNNGFHNQTKNKNL